MGMGVECPGTFAAVTALENMARKPVAHLTFADVEAIGRELDHIRMSVLESRGERDAAYIRRVIDAQRKLEMAGRVLLLASRYRPAWVLGTACLAVAKILDNMEIGHNVLHGQWDWMRDPKIHSSTWEWDHASPAEQWKRAHNVQHHTFTNILGKDNDLGYGIMRVVEEQPWKPRYLVQPLWNLVNACIFEYGIAMYDMEIGDHLRQKRGLTPELRSRIEQTLHKVGRQATKDYILFPALSGPSWRSTVAANVTANVVRNIWSHSVIMCGHFPEGVEAFEQESLPETESKGEWYLRQMLGSANISGSKAMHLMSGHLSHQIEHHLFPDLPSRRYQEIAPAVREVFHRYGLTYHAAPLATQLGSAWHKVVRLSLPNGWLKETTVRNAPAQIAKLFRSETTPRVQKQKLRPTALIAASL
ncbi:MAG: acyl-CoA desaturase [Marmoricola sp.]|nr:acyl-CoA desaturase [Marmoricola sp.]